MREWAPWVLAIAGALAVVGGMLTTQLELGNTVVAVWTQMGLVLVLVCWVVYWVRRALRP